MLSINTHSYQYCIHLTCTGGTKSAAFLLLFGLLVSRCLPFLGQFYILSWFFFLFVTSIPCCVFLVFGSLLLAVYHGLLLLFLGVVHDLLEFLRNFVEDEVNVGAVLGGYLVEGNFILLGVLQSLLLGYLSFLLHVGLVAHQHDNDFALAVLSCG